MHTASRMNPFTIYYNGCSPICQEISLKFLCFSRLALQKTDSLRQIDQEICLRRWNCRWKFDFPVGGFMDICGQTLLISKSKIKFRWDAAGANCVRPLERYEYLRANAVRPYSGFSFGFQNIKNRFPPLHRSLLHNFHMGISEKIEVFNREGLDFPQ